MSDEPPKRALMYRCGKIGNGIGHFLVSLSLYAHYARKTDRQFFISLHGSALAIDPQADTDPFFSEILDVAQGPYPDTIISYQAFSRRIDAVIKYSQDCAVVCRNPRSLSAEFPHLMAKSDAVFHLDVRSKFQQIQDLPHDVIVIDKVTPVIGGVAQHERFFEKVPAFAPFHPAIKEMRPEPHVSGGYVGVHLRHGNGEFLGIRTEGNNRDFPKLLKLVADRAGKLAVQYNLQQTLIFSDNSNTAKQIAKMTGGIVPTIDNISDSRHLDHLLAADHRKLQTVSEIACDLHFLSMASVICGGNSLFVLAAYIWSDRNRLEWIELAETDKHLWKSKKNAKRKQKLKTEWPSQNRIR